jgi:hypothetical protein
MSTVSLRRLPPGRRRGALTHAPGRRLDHRAHAHARPSVLGTVTRNEETPCGPTVCMPRALRHHGRRLPSGFNAPHGRGVRPARARRPPDGLCLLRASSGLPAGTWDSSERYGYAH